MPVSPGPGGTAPAAPAGAPSVGRRQLLAVATRGAVEVSLAAAVLPKRRVASLLGVHPGTLRRDADGTVLPLQPDAPADAIPASALLADLQAISDEYRLGLSSGIAAARQSQLLQIAAGDRDHPSGDGVLDDVERKRRQRAKDRIVGLVASSRGRVRPTDEVGLPLVGVGEPSTPESVERLADTAAARYELHDPSLEAELYAAVAAISRSELTASTDTELRLLVALAFCWRDADDLRVRLLVRRLGRLAPPDDPRCEAIMLASAGPTRAHGYVADAVRIWSSITRNPHHDDTQPMVDAHANIALALAQLPADRATPERMVASTRAAEEARASLDRSSDPDHWHALVARRHIEALLLHAAVDRYTTPGRRPARRSVPFTSRALWDDCDHQHHLLDPRSPWQIGWSLTGAARHLLELDRDGFLMSMDRAAQQVREQWEFRNQLSEYRTLARLGAGAAPSQPALVGRDEIDPVVADDGWLWEPASATTALNPNGPRVRHGLSWTLHRTLTDRPPS